MATSANLKAQPRDQKGKNAVRKLRAAGKIPAVVYGHGESTRMLAVDAHELELLFKRVHWENTIIDIEVEGERAPVKALVREVQAHAHRPMIFHVDFQQIHAGEKIYVEIPIRLVGTSPGAKAGGVLMHTVTDLEIRTTPDRIPEFLEVDISHLGINDSVHLRDITLPEGVETDIDPDRTICSVAPPAVSTAAEVAQEAASSEPEVIKRGKEED
jgi:large subunit ribosomal protein L25